MTNLLITVTSVILEEAESSKRQQESKRHNSLDLVLNDALPGSDSSLSKAKLTALINWLIMFLIAQLFH